MRIRCALWCSSLIALALFCGLGNALERELVTRMNEEHLYASVNPCNPALFDLRLRSGMLCIDPMCWLAVPIQGYAMGDCSDGRIVNLLQTQIQYERVLKALSKIPSFEYASVPYTKEVWELVHPITKDVVWRWEARHVWIPRDHTTRSDHDVADISRREEEYKQRSVVQREVNQDDCGPDYHVNPSLEGTCVINDTPNWWYWLTKTNEGLFGAMVLTIILFVKITEWTGFHPGFRQVSNNFRYDCRQLSVVCNYHMDQCLTCCRKRRQRK